MAEELVLSSSPHIFGRDSVPRIMHTVWLCLMPACAAAVWFFGVDAVRVLLVSTASCVALDVVLLRLRGSSWPAAWQAARDASAVVTGVLLALCLPPSSPTWMVVVGSLVAMALGKHVYGGLGNNPFNPALVARVFLLISFPTQMITWTPPVGKVTDTASDRAQIYSETMAAQGIEGATYATPLGLLKEAQRDGTSAEEAAEIRAEVARAYPVSSLFLGRIGGSVGEVSALALLLGGAVLLWRRIITWHIPISFVASTAAVTGLAWALRPEVYADPVVHVLSGGLLLGALFMATDPVTCPMSQPGQIIFGVGCGLLTAVIRLWGGYPEGVAFAILVMNGVTPLIDASTRPRRFGERRGRST
jgi:electron transport complex protein RnfD